MNMAVHSLTGAIKSGDEANTFYHDAHNLAGRCDYVMANPPFNVDKVKSEAAQSAGRLPFGLPGVNKAGEVSNANYLWISYFYAYLNETGRAGFVMASSATDSQGKDRDLREKLIQTGLVDVMMSVGNNFFYTKSLPCSLWFFDKGRPEALRDKVLFIDARNYYTAVDRTLNEWSEWQLKNLTAIVWLYRGEREKCESLLAEYHAVLGEGSFADARMKIEEGLAALREDAKVAVEAAAKRDKKRIQVGYDERIAEREEQLTVAKEACWLYELLRRIKLKGSTVLADRAYGKWAFREYIANHGADFCIPPKKDNADPWYVDWWLYKERHLVENFFLELKEFRRVATRYDKLASRFFSFVHLACIRILLA